MFYTYCLNSTFHVPFTKLAFTVIFSTKENQELPQTGTQYHEGRLCQFTMGKRCICRTGILRRRVEKYSS